MGFVPPPPPISRAEFHRRYEAGARTLGEFDPAFWAWLEGSRRMHLIQAAIIGIGGVLLLIMAVAMLVLP